MSALIDGLSWLLLLGGGFFVVAGGAGLLRMPDFFARLHPAGVVDTLGAVLIILGLVLQAGFTQVSAKLVLVLVLLFFTSPTATHAVSNAALVSGLMPWTKRKDND